MIELNPIHQKMIDKFFQYEHLPEALAGISQKFHELATDLAIECASLDYDPAETTVALRKLLEAKDCAVRAAL